MSIEENLRFSINSKSNLFVFYQPIIDLSSNRIVALEALVRWLHPKDGWISPVRFVPVAEQCGLIDSLQEYVLDKACKDSIHRKDSLPVAVNISAKQLGRGILVHFINKILANNKIKSNLISVEITETAIISNEADTISELKVLRDMGVQISLDDFGTGYSSLRFLRIFPFDRIKIDKSFVQDSQKKQECAAIIGAIAEMGKRMKVKVLAEGVENEEQHALILSEGCVEAQGYFYGRPSPMEDDVVSIIAAGGLP